MDWTALFTSIGGTAFVLAALAVPMKKWVERRIDHGFKRRRELLRASVREQFPQDAALHDEQIVLPRAVLELLGRIRDTAVEARELALCARLASVRRRGAHLEPSFSSPAPWQRPSRPGSS